MSALPELSPGSSCPEEEVLSGLLEGELPPEEAASWQAHVDVCGDCQQILAELRTLRDGLGQLGSLEPPTELFDRVAVAVDRHRRRGFWIGTGVVGGLGVMAVAIGLLLTSRVAVAVELPPAAPPSVRASAEAEFQKAELHYRNAVEMLEALVAEEKPQWPWRQQAAYEADVKMLRRAIAQCQSLAQRAPTDPALQELLFSSYRAQLDYLRDVLSPRSDDAL